MANWRKELRELSRREPELGEESDELVDAMHDTESDRGAALIAGSLAENFLKDIISYWLVPLGKERLEDLFEFEGPMGTFSAKIRVAHAFGIIGDDVRDDLDRLREIRNAFAHTQMPISFKNSAVANACAGFGQGLAKQIELGLDVKSEPRLAYVSTVASLAELATLAAKRKLRGHLHKLREPLTYAQAPAWTDRSRRQLGRQIREHQRSDDKKKVREGRP